MGKELYQPNELAKITGIKPSTLNGYLRDREMFPPAKVDPDNEFRYYNNVTVVDLNLLKKLTKKPFGLKIAQVKTVIKKVGFAGRAELLDKSNTEIYSLSSCLRIKCYRRDVNSG